MKKNFSLGLVIAMIQLNLPSSSFACGSASMFTSRTVVARSIHDAASAGDFDRVKALIEADSTNLDTVDVYNATPLHHAVFRGHTAIVQMLIKAGTNINAVNQNGYTALHIAARLGQTEIVQALINSGANVEATNTNCETPLHCAAQYGRTATVQTLIAAGANVNLRGPRGRTPLRLAQKYARTATVAALQPDAIIQTHTREALRWTGLGHHALAARSYNLAENYLKAAQSYISGDDYDSALKSYSKLLNSLTTRITLTSAEKIESIDRAETQIVADFEAVGVALDKELETAIDRDGDPSPAAENLRSRAVRAINVIIQVRMITEASAVVTTTLPLLPVLAGAGES